MYFDASEHIARSNDFPRSQIEAIDEFLAGDKVRRFEMRQVREKTGLNADVSAILDEYVKLRVLSKETVYLCPVHRVRLERTYRNEGKCAHCEKSYALDDCDTKTVYERIHAPDKQPAPASEVRVASSSGPVQQRRRFPKLIEWFVTDVRGCLVAIAGTLIGGYILAKILQPSNDSVTQVETTAEITQEVFVSPTTTLTIVVTPSADSPTEETTAEVTQEVTLTP